ncbi:MAG TPA: winged helix-turn-helix domain-containing protein [Bryobacteraceae bacterium]|nr:winged helix-turn-helix domain-containing protein [Bryobacteraceae bacterium]
MTGAVYFFGNARFDVSNLELTVGGQARALEPKSSRLLRYLIENRGSVASKEEIIAAVWEGVAVSDNALTRAITQIRKALEDDAKQPRYVETVPTVGYRFIAEVTEAAQPTVPPAPPPEKSVGRSQNRRWLIASALGLAVVAAGMTIWWIHIPPTPRVAGLRQVTQSAAADMWPSLSPDSNQIVFSSNRSGRFELYTKSLAPGGAERQITSDRLDNIEPAWSPDGASIAYSASSTGEIRTIPSTGGAPRTVVSGGDSPQWSPDGRLLAFRRDPLASGNGRRADETINPYASSAITNPFDRSAVAVVDVQTGAVRVLTRPEAGSARPNPHWLADGNRIVFSSPPQQNGKGARMSAISITGANPGSPIRTFEAGKWPLYPVVAPDGRSFYYSDKQADTPGIWRAWIGWLGTVSDVRSVIPIADGEARYLDLSRDGKRLAFSRQTGESAIWSISLDANGAAIGELKPVIEDRNIRNTEPWLSRDGSKLAFTTLQPDGHQVIYLANPDGSSPEPWTPASQDARSAEWVGSERKLVFLTRKDGVSSYWVGAIGGRQEQLHPDLDLTRTERIRVSNDGTMLVAHENTPAGLRVVVSPLNGGPRRSLTSPPRSIGFAFWSPDGRSIAAQERLEGRSRLVVFPSSGRGEIRVLNDSFDQIFASDWSPDGERIAFAGLNDGTWNIYWVSVTSGKTEQLTHYSGGSASGFVRYPSWSPDGRRILYERNNWKSNIYIADLQAKPQKD